MANKEKKPCKYGEKCFRKNKQHLAEFSHPSKKEEEETIEEEKPPPPKRQRKDDSVKGVNKKKSIVDYFGTKKGSKGDETDDSNKELKKSEEKMDDSDATDSGDGAKGATSSAHKDADTSDNDKDAPESPKDVKEQIKQKFLVEMPEDFYAFWEFVKCINSSKPNLAFKKSLGLELVGPFDVLGDRCVKKNSKGKSPCYLTHWRYYYDPPEFMTIIRGDDDTQYHMGYFRDDPREMPVFVAANAAKKNCNMIVRGDNLFAALSLFIDDYMKENKSSKTSLAELKKKVCAAAKEGGYSLEAKPKSLKKRDKKVNCKLFHGAGMVVPVYDNGVGYREVPETPADLKKMFKKVAEAKTDSERDAAMDPLMEIIMLVQFANDESDYGEGLELGLNMFSYGGGDAFKSTIQNLMTMAYQLLGRHEYAEIVRAHLENRLHTAELDQLK